MATTIPPWCFIKQCKYNYLKTMFMNLKCKSSTLSQCVYIKILTNDGYNDQKRKQADIKDSIAQKKRSHAKKMILRPVTPKISTKEKKCQKHDRKSMGQNLKEMTPFLKSRQNYLSKNITFSKNKYGMQKKYLSESKIKLQNLTRKMSH